MNAVDLFISGCERGEAAVARTRAADADVAWCEIGEALARLVSEAAPAEAVAGFAAALALAVRGGR